MTVLLHTGLGVLLTLGLVVYLFRGIGKDTWLARIGWVLMAAGAVLGMALIYLGTPHRLKTWLYAHIAICSVGSGAAGDGVDERARVVGGERLCNERLDSRGFCWPRRGLRGGAWWVRNVAWTNAYRVTQSGDFAGDDG